MNFWKVDFLKYVRISKESWLFMAFDRPWPKDFSLIAKEKGLQLENV